MSNQTFFADSQEEILLRKYTKIPILSWKNVDFSYFVYFDLSI